VKPRSVEDVVGAWVEPAFESRLIVRCKQYWSVPVDRLPDQVLATYLRQGIGLTVVLPEARRRLELGVSDDSELYEGELAEAVRRVDNG
jgi:hypothetical protein